MAFLPVRASHSLCHRAFVALLCFASVAAAQTPAKKPAAKAAAPAKPAASAAKPGGASTASHGPTTGGAKTTTTTTHTTTTTAGGHTSTTSTSRTTTTSHVGAPAGRTPVGSHEVHTANGSVVRTRADGSRADVHDARRGMDIHHGLNGNRRVSVERADHSRVYAERGGRGYVQHPYMYRDREYGHRTYYDHGRYYDRYYNRYPYRGGYLDVYAPASYYPVGFYGWAYNPWAVPIAYSWGWGAAPWYGYYGAYFSPYPVYPSAAFWLTDYLIATSLQAAFAARAVADDGSGGTLRIVEREDNSADAPVWTFTGNHGIGGFGTGAQPMTIESLANGNIAVRRVDTSGPWHGSALYVGHIDGNTVSGQITYFDPGGGRRSGTWTGTIEGSALGSPSAPPAGDTAGAAPLSPEVKQLVADEVKRQVALENSEAATNAQGQQADPASSGIARMLSDNQPHVFIAGSDLDLVNTAGQECPISQGDIIEVASAPPADATAATALVLSSKGGKECAKSANVTVAFNDLQDMQNHMRETIDAGMGDLQSKQGKGGLPAAPPSAQVAPVAAAFTAGAPPPDTTAGTEIAQQTQAADQAEQEVASAAPAAGGPSDSAAAVPAPIAAPPPPPPPPAAPTTIALGQTIDQVTTSMGQPTRVIDLGTKKIYVYKDMKITFKSGKVSDVE